MERNSDTYWFETSLHRAPPPPQFSACHHKTGLSHFCSQAGTNNFTKMFSLLEIITETVSKASSLITLNPLVVCCVNKTSSVTQTPTLQSYDLLVNFPKSHSLKMQNTQLHFQLQDRLTFWPHCRRQPPRGHRDISVSYTTQINVFMITKNIRKYGKMINNITFNWKSILTSMLSKVCETPLGELTKY